MTRSLPGTLSRPSAPVEVTMRFSSISMPGRPADTEPVAMTIFLVSTSVASPDCGVTSTLPGDTMVPMPRRVVILFFLNR
ncbi:hypothetical protein D3C87_1885360 [compost metagenome]